MKKIWLLILAISSTIITFTQAETPCTGSFLTGSVCTDQFSGSISVKKVDAANALQFIIKFSTGNCASQLFPSTPISPYQTAINNLTEKCIIKWHINSFRSTVPTTFYEFIKMIVNSIYYQSESKTIDIKKSIVINPSMIFSDLENNDPNTIFVVKAYQQELLKNLTTKKGKYEFFNPYRPVTYQDLMIMISNLKDQGIQIYDKPFWKSNNIISREQMANAIVTLFAFNVTEFKGYKTPIVTNIPTTKISQKMFWAAPIQTPKVPLKNISSQDYVLWVYALIPNLKYIINNVNL